MEQKIIDKKEEPLLSRTKVEAELSFDGATPSLKEVKSGLSKKLGKSVQLLDVKKIHTRYGSKKADVTCFAYNDEKALSRIRILGKKAREKIKKQEEEGKKQEEAKEEKTGSKEAESKEEVKGSKESEGAAKEGSEGKENAKEEQEKKAGSEEKPKESKEDKK